MNPITANLGLYFGPNAKFAWPLVRAVIHVWRIPRGGFHRAAWNIYCDDHTRFGCAFAFEQNGEVVFSPLGQHLVQILSALPGWNAEAYHAAHNAIAEGQQADFVCWVRPSPDTTV